MNSELNTILVELANKLNTTVDKLYVVLSKQVYISTISDIIELVIWGVLFFFAGRYLYKQKVEKDLYGDIPFGVGISRILFFCGTFYLCLFVLLYQLRSCDSYL